MPTFTGKCQLKLAFYGAPPRAPPFTPTDPTAGGWRHHDETRLPSSRHRNQNPKPEPAPNSTFWNPIFSIRERELRVLVLSFVRNSRVLVFFSDRGRISRQQLRSMPSGTVLATPISTSALCRQEPFSRRQSQRRDYAVRKTAAVRRSRCGCIARRRAPGRGARAAVANEEAVVTSAMWWPIRPARRTARTTPSHAFAWLGCLGAWRVLPFWAVGSVGPSTRESSTSLNSCRSAMEVNSEGTVRAVES